MLSKKLLHEPLLHFTVIGLLTFAIYRLMNPIDDSATLTITIDDQTLKPLVANWKQTWRRVPDKQELQGIVAGYIEEEIYYREARKLGLDTHDTIVRRRLHQKMQFLNQDLQIITEPDDEVLQAFYQARKADYAEDDRVNFYFLFFSEPSIASKARANAAYQALSVDDKAVPVDDKTLLQKHYQGVSESELGRLLGYDFAQQLFSQGKRGWNSALKSAYGYHVVYVDQFSRGQEPDFESIRTLLREEWMSEQRKLQNQQLYDQLKSQYTIVMASEQL